MPLPFREPFFLRGQQHWLVRAIRMSLVLGGLGFVMGTIWFLGVWVALNGLDSWNWDEMELVFGAALGGLMLSPLSISYSRWRGDSLLGLILRALWIPVATTVPWLSSPYFQPEVDEWYVWLEDHLASITDMPLSYGFYFMFLWLAWTSAFFRPVKTWLMMAGLSLVSLPLSIIMIHFADQNSGLHLFWSPWITLAEVLEMASSFSIGGQYFALLLIPWGLPFWWPPERTLDSPLTK